MPHSSPFLRLVAAGIVMLGSSQAHAQYSWIDAKGVRHFSDRPPPPSIAPHKVLKAPGRAAPPAPPAQAAPAADPAKTLAQREEDYRARVRQREEQDKKEALDARRRRELLDACQARREMRAQLASGMRIAKLDAKGERSFMTDEERAAQMARAERTLAQCP